MLLKDKVVLVTGASAGIGRAVAIEAAWRGADLAINYFDPTDVAAKDTVSAIKAIGRRAIAVKCDVAVAGSAAIFGGAAMKAFGWIDVFVSNAGICRRLGVLEDLAGPVMVLASDMARYVNGAALLVDGGMFVNPQ